MPTSTVSLGARHASLAQRRPGEGTQEFDMAHDEFLGGAVSNLDVLTPHRRPRPRNRPRPASVPSPGSGPDYAVQGAGRRLARERQGRSRPVARAIVSLEGCPEIEGSADPRTARGHPAAALGKTPHDNFRLCLFVRLRRRRVRLRDKNSFYLSEQIGSAEPFFIAFLAAPLL
jgi:hypothetical protein